MRSTPRSSASSIVSTTGSGEGQDADVSQVLPPLLIALATTTLVLVLLSLWSSVRALLAAAGGAHAGSRTLPERERLLAEKKALLTAIKDLEFERDVGKLSEDDYERLDARYRAQARRVLGALEAQVGPHRDRARGLIEACIAGAAPGEGAAAPTATEPEASPQAVAGADAHTCGAHNDADAVFCKKCGARLRPEGAS